MRFRCLVTDPDTPLEQLVKLQDMYHSITALGSLLRVPEIVKSAANVGHLWFRESMIDSLGIPQVPIDFSLPAVLASFSVVDATPTRSQVCLPH